MYRIESHIDTDSPEFQENRARMKDLVAELQERLAEVKKGGPPKAIDKHKARGKLTVRERLDRLLDRNTPFLELSALCAYGLHKNEAPCAGIVTGIGVIHGKEVLIVAYVNAAALNYTLEHGVAAFWSTSRDKLWVKGETSGDTLQLVEVRVNCEQNSLVYLVKPLGEGACHTKCADGTARQSCYYRRIKDWKLEHVE